MLNFINLLSDRPAPIKGGRIVRGSAMSGCKDADTFVGNTVWAHAAQANQTRAERDKERREARLALVLAEVPHDRLASTLEIVKTAECGKSTAQEALRELLKRKLVSRSRRRLKHGVQYYWRRI